MWWSDVLHAVAGDERLLQNAAAAQVAHFRPNGGVAAARLVMGVLEHLVEVAVEFEGDAFAQIVDVDHGRFILTGSKVAL
jgi:predicted ATP-dependent serine protease